MKKREIFAKIFVGICVFTIIYGLTITTISYVSESQLEYISLDPIEDLDLTRLKSIWEDKGKVEFENQGINVTIENKFSKILATIQETKGRDVSVSILVPAEYISPSVLGHIKTNSTTITWVTTNNETWLKFNMRAHDTIYLEISKGSLLKGRIKKGIHNFWNYVEYNGDAKENETNVIIFIDKSQSDFEIDNKHMIVQYKTDFWGWYYPVEEASSGDSYYYVDDLGEQYRVVTHFKTENPGDIKIHAFPGATPGWNWDSVKGGIARSWISLQIGVKKAVMDIWDPQPAYE